MRNRLTHTGFTLVELVMVIVIIGLLAAVVMPKFSDIKTEAQSAAEEGAVAAVRSGIKLAHMSSLAQGSDTYPTTLDSASNGDASETNPLFTDVVEGGITDGNWKKTGTRRYEYKPTKARYTYDRSTGKFTKL
jgi:prepilin-type N-terminal cleavage/methylation domain-containing protein